MGNRPFMPGSNLYGPSENIWGNIPVDQILAGDRSCGFGFHDDFMRFSGTTLTDGYVHLQSAGCDVEQITSETNHPGIVRLSIDGNGENDEAVIQLGNALDVGAFDLLNDCVAFEAYIRPSATTADKWAWFNGLAIGGAAGAAITDKMFADDTQTVFATADFVGFQHLHGESTALDAMYQASGQTKVDGAVNTDLDAIGTLAAATWVKVGFLYIPHPRRLTWFVDGAEVCHIAKTDLDAAAFPDAVFMTPTFGVKDGAGDAALNLDMDWWRCMQFTGL